MSIQFSCESVFKLVVSFGTSREYTNHGDFLYRHEENGDVEEENPGIRLYLYVAS